MHTHGGINYKRVRKLIVDTGHATCARVQTSQLTLERDKKIALYNRRDVLSLVE